MNVFSAHSASGGGVVQGLLSEAFYRILSDNSMFYRGCLSTTYVEHCQNTLCLVDRQKRLL